jgi:hypothetical protein
MTGILQSVLRSAFRNGSADHTINQQPAPRDENIMDKAKIVEEGA